MTSPRMWMALSAAAVVMMVVLSGMVLWVQVSGTADRQEAAEQAEERESRILDAIEDAIDRLGGAADDVDDAVEELERR